MLYGGLGHKSPLLACFQFPAFGTGWSHLVPSASQPGTAKKPRSGPPKAHFLKATATACAPLPRVKAKKRLFSSQWFDGSCDFDL